MPAAVAAAAPAGQVTAVTPDQSNDEAVDLADKLSISVQHGIIVPVSLRPVQCRRIRRASALGVRRKAALERAAGERRYGLLLLFAQTIGAGADCCISTFCGQLSLPHFHIARRSNVPHHEQKGAEGKSLP